MSSNIGQNYPYGSETESQRAAAVEHASGAFDGLGARIAAEATPLAGRPAGPTTGGCGPVPPTAPSEDSTWRATHASATRIFTVCDNCGKSFLR